MTAALCGLRAVEIRSFEMCIRDRAVDCNYGNTLGLGYEGLMTGNMWLHTLPDCSSKEKAIAVLKKWDAWERVDESIRRHLLSPDAGEDVLTREEFERMDCRIYGIMPDSLAPLPSAMAVSYTHLIQD